MTRQVKNIVDALNHKRERMIRSGQYDIIPPRLKKSDVWNVINNSADPQATYDWFIGTKQLPGTLRRTMPSYSPQRYKPATTSKGRTYAPASRDIDLAFNEVSNEQRKIQREIQVDAKSGYVFDSERGEIIDNVRVDKKTGYTYNTETGEILDKDELKNILDDIIDQGGALGKETLQEYGDYDSARYWKRVGTQFAVHEYVENYLEAWDKFGFSPSYFTLKNMFDKMEEKNPQGLLQVFLSGDSEADVTHIYEVWKENVAPYSLRKGPRNEGDYIVEMTRIVRYWQEKYNEVMGDE